jgi:CRP-like cAMP-binding protein
VPLYQVPENSILRIVPEEILLPIATVMTFPEGYVFLRPNEAPQYVVFPLRGIISVALAANPGNFVEVASVGNEGVIGLQYFLETEDTQWWATARTSCEACVMRPADFQRCFRENASLTSALLRYSHLILFVLSQLSVCAGAHTIEKRCARWLLTMQDKMQSDTFSLTQEFFARTLGVRTASINVTLGKFQRAGSILYERGRLTIVDRKPLETVVCDCYSKLKTEFERFEHQLQMMR